MAENRKKTKTPPGFLDSKDGDFFIWLDMLEGLIVAQDRNIPFTQVALVTTDKKTDWSRGGIAHPILCAEVRTLIGVPFETWDIGKLMREVAAFSG